MAKRKERIEFDLKGKRKYYGLTATAVAKKIGVSRVTLHRMEMEKAIPVDRYMQFHSICPELFPLVQKAN